MKTTWIWSLLLVAGMLSGCGSNVSLDNPRAEAVVFTIDGGDSYTVGPGEMQQISLGEGQHKVQLKSGNGQTLGDTTFTLKNAGLLQAKACNYVVWRQLYGLQAERKTLLNEDWVMVDSTRFYGDIKIYPANQIFLEKNWDLGLDQKLPESTALYVTKDYKIETKIFREQDFIAVYREMSEKNKSK